MHYYRCALCFVSIVLFHSQCRWYSSSPPLIYIFLWITLCSGHCCFIRFFYHFPLSSFLFMLLYFKPIHFSSHPPFLRCQCLMLCVGSATVRHVWFVLQLRRSQFCEEYQAHPLLTACLYDSHACIFQWGSVAKWHALSSVIFLSQFIIHFTGCKVSI